MSKPSLLRAAWLVAASMALSASSFATGVQPETSLLLIQEEDGMGQMVVTNTDTVPLLLHSTVEDVSGEEPFTVVQSPAAIRLEPGARQIVNFVLVKDQPLTVQRFKRALFEGIPPAQSGRNVVQMVIRTDLPLIVNPKGLKIDQEPWKLLRWSRRDGAIEVTNPSPFIVRLSNRVELHPGKRDAALQETYVLPGRTVRLNTPQEGIDGVTTIRIHPSSLYGYAVDAYDAQLD